MDRDKFIENLRSARESRGLTQKQVSEALGVSDRTCSKWETGETEPGIELICRLAAFYGLSPADFFKEDAPQEGAVRREFGALTPVQGILRTRDMIDEAYEGMAESVSARWKQLADGDGGEAERFLTEPEPLPTERPKEGFISNRIGSSNGFLLRCWDRELNFRLLMLPAEGGFAGLMEGAKELGELFGLLRHAELLLPLMEAAKDRRWHDYFTPAHLARGTGLTAEEADETLKAMERWGLCTRHEMETGAGDHWLYAAAETDLLWGILALARLLLRDMRERRDDRTRRGEAT